MTDKVFMSKAEQRRYEAQVMKRDKFISQQSARALLEAAKYAWVVMFEEEPRGTRYPGARRKLFEAINYMTTESPHARKGRAATMNSPKWTKGPWKIEDYGGDNWTCDYSILGADGEYILVGPGIRNAKDSKANARLIAAAPEMAVILQEIVDDDGWAGNESTQDMARAILAKIEGEENV